MLYDNFEKDRSSGIVKGKEDGGILKLWYDFNSEGMRSVMEVYFKKDNGRLLLGIGSMDQKTDTTYFTSGINYSDKEAFNKVDCALVGSKLKF
jgi:peptidyl-tRNA hydrolase